MNAPFIVAQAITHWPSAVANDRQADQARQRPGRVGAARRQHATRFFRHRQRSDHARSRRQSARHSVRQSGDAHRRAVLRRQRQSARQCCDRSRQPHCRRPGIRRPVSDHDRSEHPAGAGGAGGGGDGFGAGDPTVDALNVGNPLDLLGGEEGTPRHLQHQRNSRPQ